MTYFVCSEPAALGCVTYLAPPPVVIFCFYRCFILKVLEFHFPDIIVSLFPLFYFFPPSSIPTATPLSGRRWLRFEFPMQRRGIFLAWAELFLFSMQHEDVPGFSFFLHLLWKPLHYNPLPFPSPSWPPSPLPPPSTPTQPKCLRAICNLLNPAKIEIYVPLDKGYPAIMLCMCWYALASRVETLVQWNVAVS